MKLFDFLKRDRDTSFEIPPRRSRELSDDELEERSIKTLETKIRRSRLRMLQERYKRLQEKHEELLLEEDIHALEQDLYGSDDDGDEDTPENPDALLMSLLTKALNGGSKSTPRETPILSEPPKKAYTDEELKTFIARVPTKIKKQLAKLDDEQLIEAINLNAPDFYHSADDDSIARTIKILRA